MTVVHTVNECPAVVLLMPACLTRRGVTNQVQLSTYGDSIGNNLADLSAFLQEHVDGEGVDSLRSWRQSVCIA